MTSNQELEENLLEGIAMTSAGSCPTPETSGQFIVDIKEGFSYTLKDEEEIFHLSSN